MTREHISQRKAVITIAIYHCSIKIISRSSGRSAIASAAYRSGSTLYDAETGLTHDYTRKGGVILSEIMLPEKAPPEYADRQTLWTEVEKQESRSDAAIAREIEVALPTEMTRDQQIECVRRYIQDNFVDKGMIADWALHDKGDGNPHTHILLTTRGFDKKGKWERKTKSVFANTLDADGKAIYDPALPSYDPHEPKGESGHRPSEQYRIPQLNPDGTQKTRLRKGKGEEKLWCRVNIPTHDWDSHLKAEEWREAWANTCNLYLEAENQIDHRSFKRQGITDREPTIHEGVSARQIEQRGKISDRCEINREIREKNRLIETLKQEIKKIKTSAITHLKLLREKLRDGISDLASLKKQEDDLIKSGQLLQEQVAAYDIERIRINQKIAGSLEKIVSLQKERKSPSSKNRKRKREISESIDGELGKIKSQRQYLQTLALRYGFSNPAAYQKRKTEADAYATQLTEIKDKKQKLSAEILLLESTAKEEAQFVNVFSSEGNPQPEITLDKQEHRKRRSR